MATIKTQDGARRDPAQGRPWPGRAAPGVREVEAVYGHGEAFNANAVCIACLERVLEIGARDHANYSPGAYYWAIRRELERLRGNSPESPEGSR